ncbi:MAG: hypothetical protein EBU06_00685 [Micrococcales bacterium]|nr:hypothetical protein [Micrococcales bacterium]NBY44120.1 hypothetical protein [Micrococcales bacterium]NDE88498.1 hypothetical protein [Micrococcales bacterium]
MAKVYVSADSLHVELSFWETIGSFSRGFVIPLGDILTVEKSDKLDFNILGLRIGGSAIPYVFAYGNYRKNKQWIFSVWKKPQEAVILTLKNHRFEKLVLGVTDAEALLSSLSARV